MNPQLDTPTVEQRDLHFDFGDADLQRWHPAGKQVSLFFAALSPFFPEGEKFFIRSVRHFADQAADDPRLAADIRGFIGQEAMHGREHTAFNRALDAAGLPAQAVENFVIKDLRWTERRFSPQACLAVTIALEHFTAIMASALLAHPAALNGADERIARLWRWHAIEETEHKAVAFDLYQRVMPGWRGYWLRVGMFLMSSFFFWLETTVVHFNFCRRAGCLKDLKGWGRFLAYFWIKPGMFRRILLPWLRYLKPGFHPWDDDNRAEIERWMAREDGAAAQR